jgi:hypothetical protein
MTKVRRGHMQIDGFLTPAVHVEDYDSLAAELARLHEDLAALRSSQIDGGMEAEMWHQFRMMMDRALGEAVDPYVRADSFKALAALLEDRDRLRAALVFLGKAFELEDDQTDVGITYREALRGAVQPTAGRECGACGHWIAKGASESCSLGHQTGYCEDPCPENPKCECTKRRMDEIMRGPDQTSEGPK